MFRRLAGILVAIAGIGLAQAWLQAGGQGKSDAGKAKPPASGCGTAFTMADASFRTLEGVRDASVWADDIDSSLLGGFQPFEVYVVTGKLYAPFQLKEGKLGRDNFRKYTANNYNTQPQGPLTIADSHPRGQLAFVQDDRRYVLKVTSVTPSKLDRDTLTIQLCW